VLHVALALYIFAFSLGIAALILSLMAHARYRGITFRGLALLLAAMLLILVMDILKVYGRTAGADLGPIQPYLFAVISALSFGLLAYMVPFLCSRIIGHRVTLPLQAAYAFVGVVMAVLGALREMVPGRTTLAASTLGLIGIQAYGVCLVLPRLKRILNLPLRSLIRDFAWLFIVGIAATCVELALRFQPGMPPFFQDVSVVEILYCFVAGAMLLTHAFGHLFMIERNSTVMLPEPFIKRFGISPRERQIVAMMIQGYSNRRIGEELFISSITVKNHIYHIYQKTGAENKVQLINLLNPPK
jgi:DNA-binding CsgD family transcriptional regulator